MPTSVLKVYLKYVRKSYQIPGIHIARAAIQITLPPCMHSTFPVFSYLNFHEIIHWPIDFLFQ